MIISGRSGSPPSLLFRLLAIALATILTTAATGASGISSPWPQRWSEHLDRDVLPFWLADNERTPSPALPEARMQDRVFSLRLRALYVLAVALSRQKDEDVRNLLRMRFDHRYAALVSRFYDPQTADWLSTADADVPIPDLSRQKRDTADQAWAILILDDIHRLAGKPDARRLAGETFRRIDSLAHDDLYGGYFVDYDNPPSAASAHPDRDPESVRKHASTQVHMMLALARLLRVDPGNAAIRSRLEELVSLVPRFVSTETGHVRWALGRDWLPATFARPINNRTLYGLNAETISYLLNANDALGRPPSAVLPLVECIARGLLRDGISPDGAVWYVGPMEGSADDRRVWWWPQVETAAAMWSLFRLTRRDDYLAAFGKVSAWAHAHLVPAETPGRWVTVCTADGQPLPHTAAAHEIQTGFHVARCVLAIEKN